MDDSRINYKNSVICKGLTHSPVLAIFILDNGTGRDEAAREARPINPIA
jgi:hypothetical protein